MTLADLAVLFRPFGLICSKKLLSIHSFNYDRTWWRLLQKRVVRTKLDIYIFIIINQNINQSKSSEGQSWSWSYYIWIYNYLCNQCMSPLILWVWISSGRGLLDTKLCDKVCLWLATGRWFTPVTPVDSTNKTDPHDDIAELLLKVALNSINKQKNNPYRVHVITIYFNSYIYVFNIKAYLNLLNNIQLIYTCIEIWQNVKSHQNLTKGDTLQ